MLFRSLIAQLANLPVFPESVPINDLVRVPGTASASRIYAFDPNSIIAKQDEENLIYQELLDNVTGQVLRQMRRAEAGLAP